MRIWDTMMRWLLVSLMFCLHALCGSGVNAAEPPPTCWGDIDDLVLHVFEPFGPVAPLRLCSEVGAGLDFGVADTLVSFVIDQDTLPDTGRDVLYGLATYYNKVQVRLIRGTSVLSPFDDDEAEFRPADWIILSGRYSVLLLHASGASFSRKGRRLTMSWSPGDRVLVKARIVDKGRLSIADPQWRSQRYTHLWDWLAGLTQIIEWGLLAVNKLLGGNWGVSILVFAVIMKILLLPTALLTMRFQRQVSKLQAILTPRLSEIKATYKGQEAHERVMAAHKDLGVTPFFTLRPMIGSVIQIPVVVAIFAAFGEMPQFASISFLWINDLSIPDSVATLSFSIPWFGDKVSLLPVVMTILTVFSTVVYRDPHAPGTELRRQKRNLYFMAFGFFILFYPFPAAMVYYWMIVNGLQVIQQHLIKL